MDLVRVTEAAALSSARWLGKGDKEAGDQAAVDAMRLSFETLNIDGRVVIGDQVEIYAGKIGLDEALARIDRAYVPYHMRLHRELALRHGRHGAVVLLDLHSMPSQSMSRAMPDIVLGDRFGRKRMFLAGLALFTVGSALAAIAPSMSASGSISSLA
jgi:hypothetical protein